MKCVLEKDIERTYSEREEFRTKEMRNLISNVLMTWGILNKDIGYRQGNFLGLKIRHERY
jgi:hypothetical protein